MRRVVARASVVGVVTAAALTVAAIAPSRAALERARAPRFVVEDLAGRTLDLDTLLARGPVLLDFWATWCKPCHAAIPELNAWHEAYAAQGLTIIGVSVDGPRNHPKVRPFVQRMGIRYPIVIDDDGRLQHLYQAQALPTAVLVGPGRAVVFSRIGFQRGEGAQYEKKIRETLGLEPEGEAAAPAGIGMPAPESAFDSLRVPPPADSLAAPHRRREMGGAEP